MKLLFIITITLFSLNSFSQNTYNNKIGQVKELNIYGKDANVVIGKIIINNSIDPPSIKLLESFQSSTPDQDGFYLTAFAFGTNNVLPLYNIDLHLKFNYHVDSLREVGISYEIRPQNAINGLSADSLSYSHMSSETHASLLGKAIFVVRIKSRRKIETAISGVDAN